jgi:MFS family permease
LLVFNLLAIGGYAIVVVIPHWQAVIGGSLLFLSWSAISLPGTMGLISTALPKGKHVMGVSLHSLVRRLPMALGPVLGGVFIDTWGPVKGVRIAFLVAIAMAVVALVMQQILMEEDARKPGAKEPDPNPLRMLRDFSAPLRKLLLADILIRFCEQIPYPYVVLWCMRDAPGYATAHVTGTQFGILTTIEMATAVICYLPVARFADQGMKKPFVTTTFINFAAFPLVLFFSRSYTWLIAAFIVRGLKEFGEPTRKALILDLAPEGRKPAAFGAYYLVRDTIVSLAAVSGALLWRIGPQVNFLTAFAFGVAGAIWFGLAGSDKTNKEEKSHAIGRWTTTGTN